MANDYAASHTSSTYSEDGKYLAELARYRDAMEPSTSSQLTVEFNKSQTKCNQTKFYCQDFIQSFEELQQQCKRNTLFRLYCKVVYELVTRVHGLCKCSNCLVQLKDVINELCSSCAQYIISDDFSSVPEAFRLNLSDALQAAQEELKDWAGDRFFRLAGLCVAPWSHPFLVAIIEGLTGPNGLERTQNYISYEGFDLLSSRVKILLEKDPNKAVKLCQACAEHHEIGTDSVFLETALVVLYNQGMPPDFSMQVWIQKSARVLEALKNLQTYYPPPVVKLVDTLLLKEWNKEYNSLNEEQLDDLLALWINTHYKHGSLDEVYGAAVDLAMYNDNTKTVIHFADTIMKQIGQEALPLFVNLLVDNIQVPFHRLDEEECQVANQNNALISDRLAEVLSESSELQCLCRMANFVSCPSNQNYLKLEKAYVTAKDDFKVPSIPLLSSRLDLVLTKVILGLLPKSFNPWKDWDSLEKLCNKLKKTTKQIETVSKDDAGNLNGVVSYKKPSWFLTMLEEDWACYAKGTRNKDGEIVCDSQEEAVDMTEISHELSEDPRSCDELVTNSTTHTKDKIEGKLKCTKTAKSDNSFENKIKHKRGRKSLKDRLAMANGNKMLKRKLKKNVDEKDLIIDQQNENGNESKGDGSDSVVPRKKRGRKRKTEVVKDTESCVNSIVDTKKTDVSEEKCSVKDKTENSIDNESPLSLETNAENMVDTGKKNQKVAKKRRRQRDDFGIGRRRKKPNKKNQTSEDKCKLKSQETDDEDDDDDSETDEEPIPNVKEPKSEISLNLPDSPLNRCCLTQLETPPPDTNSCLPLSVKSDSYEDTQVPSLTQEINKILTDNLFTNGNCIKDKVSFNELDKQLKKKKLGSESPSASPLKKKVKWTPKKQGISHEISTVKSKCASKLKDNCSSIKEGKRKTKSKEAIPLLKHANGTLPKKEIGKSFTMRSSNSIPVVRMNKHSSPLKEGSVGLPENEENNGSSVKEMKCASLTKCSPGKHTNVSSATTNVSQLKTTRNDFPVNEPHDVFPEKLTTDTSQLHAVNNSLLPKDVRNSSPIKNTKNGSPGKNKVSERCSEGKIKGRKTPVRVVVSEACNSKPFMKCEENSVNQVEESHLSRSCTTDKDNRALDSNTDKEIAVKGDQDNEEQNKPSVIKLTDDAENCNKVDKVVTDCTRIASKRNYTNLPMLPCMIKASAGMRRTHSRVVELSLRKSAKEKQDRNQKSNIGLEANLSDNGNCFKKSSKECLSEEIEMELDEVSGLFRGSKLKGYQRKSPKHSESEKMNTESDATVVFRDNAQKSALKCTTVNDLEISESNKNGRKCFDNVMCNELSKNHTERADEGNVPKKRARQKSKAKIEKEKSVCQENKLSKDVSTVNCLEKVDDTGIGKDILASNLDVGESDAKKKRTVTSKTRTGCGTRRSNQKTNSVEVLENANKNNLSHQTDKSPNKDNLISDVSGNKNAQTIEMHNTRFRNKKHTGVQNASQVIDKLGNRQANSTSKPAETVNKNISNYDTIKQYSEQCDNTKHLNVYQNTHTENTQTQNKSMFNNDRVRRSSGRRLIENSNSRVTKSKNNLISDSIDEHVKLDSHVKSLDEITTSGSKTQARRICTRQSSAGGRLVATCGKSSSLGSVSEQDTELKVAETTFSEAKKDDERSQEDKPLFKDIKRYTRERKSL